MEDIIGIIIGIISIIVFLILPIIMIIRAIMKPEQIDVENGKIKIKKGAIFYNLALQNPIYVKITLLFLFVIIFFSFLMCHYGIDDEFFSLFFKFFMFICATLLFIQCVEERKTLVLGFLPIIIYCAYIVKVLKFVIVKLFHLLKTLLGFVVDFAFILPFRLIYKILGIK